MHWKVLNVDKETVMDVGPAAISVQQNSARFSLRGGLRYVPVLSDTFGVSLPLRIGACACAGNREALCLGPDEWVLLAPEDDCVTIESDFEAIYETAPHSLTDISDRDVTIEISGAEAETLITVGCPINLDSIPVGEGKRTIFNGIQIVLYKDSQKDFRIDVWRSFLPHVLGLLSKANAEFSAGL